MTGTLERELREVALSAYSRHAWKEAGEAFARADAAGALGPDDLDAFAETLWWNADIDRSLALRERAFAARSAAGEKRTAAGTALLIVRTHLIRGSDALGEAWLARAEKLLEGDESSVERGYTIFFRAMFATESGDHGRGIALTHDAQRIAERHGDRDLLALAICHRGQALIATGEVREGMALVNEATVAAVSGDLSLFVTGWIYCNTISSCRDLGDMRRAGEWTEAAHRWCERQSVTAYPGVCRVRRAELLALRGALARAEQEVRAACEDLERFGIRSAVLEGYYEVGQIRLRMGDLAGAEEAFRQVHELGRAPEPGLSLVRLAEGKAAAANASLRRTLADVRERPARARMLPAQVEVALAAGDADTARRASEELAEIAATFGTPALAAHADQWRGAVLLAAGEAGALPALRRALEGWQRLDAPYETARTRLLLAQAHRAAGDDEAARLELGSAKATFERIGATRDARAAAAALGEDAPPSAAGPRVARTFLFTDIVRSTELVAAIGDEAWQDLIRWHDDALRRIIAEHGGEEIRHQGDGLAVAFDDPDGAVGAAVAIQRRLAAHRRESGFAPPVRIGVHRAEVAARGRDYAGVGIHEAARVAAIAGGGEIVASRAALGALRTAVPTSEPRTVELKGVGAPVEVASVGWR